eukprot:gene17892-29625_t
MLKLAVTLMLSTAATVAHVRDRYAVYMQAGGSACNYTKHINISFLGNNILLCKNNEGLEDCRARCTADDHCAGFGLYVTAGTKNGRCCTKKNNDGSVAWLQGVSYTKDVVPASCPFIPSPMPTPIPPGAGDVIQSKAPPNVAPVTISEIFSGNATFPYNKGAMLELLPGGWIAAACQV